MTQIVDERRYVFSSQGIACFVTDETSKVVAYYLDENKSSPLDLIYTARDIYTHVNLLFVGDDLKPLMPDNAYTCLKAWSSTRGSEVWAEFELPKSKYNCADVVWKFGFGEPDWPIRIKIKRL